MFEIDKDALPFVRTRQALLVLDLQNEFLSSEGQLPVEQPPHFVDNILKLLPEFRTSGNVIWIRSVFEASRPVNGMGDDSEEVLTDRELLPGLDQVEAMRNSRMRMSETLAGRKGKDGSASSRAAELISMMEADDEEETPTEEAFLTIPPGEKPRFVLPQSEAVKPPVDVLNGYLVEKDILIQKSYYSAFKDGTLVQMLRSRFITEIYICGALTNMCVYATAVDAAQFGLAITLVDDCLGYRSKERHDEALRRLLVSTGCDNVTSTELIQDLKQKAKIAQQQVAPTPRPIRRQPSKQREKKVREPELESMMSELNLKPDGSSVPGAESHSPPPPMSSVPSLVADTESGGSFESIESESQNFQLPTFPARRGGEETGRPERVPAKIKTRKRTTKKSPNDSASQSTESIPSSSAPQSSPKVPTSEPSSQNSQKMPKKAAGENVAEVAGHTVSKTAEAGKIKPKAGQSVQKPKSTIDSSSTEVEKTPPNAGDEPPSICEGDTTIITNLLKGDLAEGIFEKIRDEVRWQKMSHQGGDVPRLVAVQGRIGDDGSIPIYRHPADESPPLLPFSPTVSLIREEAEKKLGHPLNHVLIQFYRDGTDYISEHSDKTLDIVPKTFIVNVSLGAQRTMIFRTKKQQNSDGSKSTEPAAPRQATRAPMPHNSMCKVGLVTNMRWLHGIRQDKRLASEKSDAELAYGTARISLTFRQIGTFLSKDQQKIWGQGAVSKSQEKANFVINGNTPEAEKMIRAFGQENHSSEFDWAGHYGAGFDVLHLNNTPKLFLSGDKISDTRVKLALAEHGIKWEEGKLSSSFKWKDGSLKADAPEIPSNLPVKFVDNDLSKSTITGDIAILLYLDTVYGPKSRSQLEIATLYTRLQRAAETKGELYNEPFDVKSFELGMESWEAFAKEGEYLAGKDISIVDWMILPALDEIYNEYGLGEELEALKAYYARIRARDSVVAALGPVKDKDALNKEGNEAKKEIEEADDDDDDDDDEES